MKKGSCFSCQVEFEFGDRVGRKEECPNCSADVHVCRNCLHYDTSAYNECRESSAERCLEKERSNFCDYFELGGQKDGSARGEDLKAAAEALFKK